MNRLYENRFKFKDQLIIAFSLVIIIVTLFFLFSIDEDMVPHQYYNFYDKFMIYGLPIAIYLIFDRVYLYGSYQLKRNTLRVKVLSKLGPFFSTKQYDLRKLKEIEYMSEKEKVRIQFKEASVLVPVGNLYFINRGRKEKVQPTSFVDFLEETMAGEANN